MARPNLLHPDQPEVVRLALRVYHFFASLGLAVTLIFGLAATLALGTFVEAAYGTPAAQFFVYQTWWFSLLMALLAINIFCAASIRFPWKRHQTGFVITHIGLLTLIFGAALSRWNGVDSQIYVFEGRASQYAFSDDFKARLHISPKKENAGKPLTVPVAFHAGPFNWSDYATHFNLLSDPPPGESSKPAPTGLGLWANRVFRFANGCVFSLANRAQPGDVLYDRNGVKLEVLQYHSDSRRLHAPHVHLMMSMPAERDTDADGQEIVKKPLWMPVRLSLRPFRGPQPEYPHGVGTRVTRGGGALLLTMSKDAEQTAAFLHNRPQGPLGGQGQVVLRVGGETSRFLVEEKLGQGRFALPGGKLFAEVVEFWPQAESFRDDATGAMRWRRGPGDAPLSPVVKLRLYGASSGKAAAGHPAADAPASDLKSGDLKSGDLKSGDLKSGDLKSGDLKSGDLKSGDLKSGDLKSGDLKSGDLKSGDPPAAEMLLFAVEPEYNMQAHDAAVFGDYWFDHQGLGQAERERAGVTQRLEFLQGHDQKLYYRYWNRQTVVFARELPPTGSVDASHPAFEMPIAKLRLYVKEFIPADLPTEIFLPKAFNRELNIGMKTPVAQLRLTADGASETFWLTASMLEPGETPNSVFQQHTLETDKRLVSVELPFDVENVGFRVKLQKFQRKLDPGTSQAAKFSSTVDFVDLLADRALRTASASGGRPRELPLPAEPTRGGAAKSDPTAGDKTAGDKTADAANEEFSPASLEADRLCVAGEHVYWIHSSGERIYRRRLGATPAPAEVVFQSQGRRVLALAVDAERQRLYFSELVTSREFDVGLLRAARLNGADVATVTHLPRAARALALDAKRRKLYWYDGQGYLGGARVDGQEVEAELAAGLEEPGDLLVDPRDGAVYWTESRGENIGVHRLTPDGQPEQALRRPDSRAPWGLALDTQRDRLFWTELDRGPRFDEKYPDRPIPRVDRVCAAPLTDLNNVKELSLGGLSDPRDIDVDPQANELYWSQAAAQAHDVWITMNAPVEHSDPRTGRTYRVFQEAFNGPFKPGDEAFEQVVPADSPIDELYRSILTVNYDPGRGVRNVGCLLVVLGIATMFYMRAYFFKKSPKPASEEIVLAEVAAPVEAAAAALAARDDARGDKREPRWARKR